MSTYETAIKALHLPAGLIARGLVEGVKYAVNRSEKLQNFSNKKIKGYGTKATGIGIPTLDTILEYCPQFKTTKDELVGTITGGSGAPVDWVDQINDFIWFEFGYFAPEIYQTYKEGFKHSYLTIKNKFS